MNKEDKKLLKNMKKRIPNFSGLGLQDLYENNQIYNKFFRICFNEKMK